MVDLIIPIVFMLAVVLGEACLLQYLRKEPVNWRDVMFNLNSGHVVLWLFRGLEIFCYGLVVTHFSLNWVSSWPAPLVWIFALLAWDFGFYWLHRLHHKFGPLWAVHVVHHQGEHFNLSLGVRNSWYSSLTNFPFIAILAVLGVPLEVFLVVSSLHYSVQFYNHNALVNKSGILDKFLVTPSHHRVHHGTDKRYINRNFGGTLLLWDKVFGSFQPELDGVEMRYGVKGMAPTHNPLLASNGKLFKWLRVRFPNWQSRGLFHVPELYIGIGGVILFGLVIYYVNHEAALAGAQQAILFALIFGGTLALGGLSDARRWGAIAWVGIALAMPLLFFGWYGVRDAWGMVFLGALLVHGLDGARRLCWPAAAGTRA